MRKSADGQLHTAAGTKARVLCVPGREEARTGLPATAGRRLRSRPFASRALRAHGTDVCRFLQVHQLIRTLSYHSGTRRVCVELRDGSRFDYVLPVPVRPGVPAREGKRLSRARLPRISRLLALALRFENLVDEGVVRNYRELAEVGHVSRPRLSQIMQLTQLAPEIQEQVLFLPPTLEGPDRMFERCPSREFPKPQLRRNLSICA